MLALRTSWIESNPEPFARLMRALDKAAAHIENPANREEVVAILSAPHRIGVTREVMERVLAGRLKVSPDGTVRTSPRHLLIGRAQAARPDPAQAAWVYAQMVRWGQAPLSPLMLKQAKEVFRPDLYDALLGNGGAMPAGEPADGIGAFAGPAFDPNDVEGYLSACSIRRE